jgi:hypothetical protein
VSGQSWAQLIGAIVGVLGILGVLARISYQLGALVNEFRAYVKLNDLLVGKLDTRVERLELSARRRR